MAAIDPTKVGKYPVILSPELLGKPSTETYTGIRYNHKPTLSSDTAPDTAFLKKSAQAGTFNLGFKDNGAQYQYKGVRTTDDGNYVLIFDPKRQAFVLHRVDSMFHMNLVRTPNEGIESLRKKFPQLEIKNEGATASKPSLKNSADEKKSAANGSANKKSVSFKDGPKVPAPRKAAPLKAPVRAPKGKGKAALAERKAPVSITLPDPNAKPKVSLPMPALPAKKAPEPEKKPNKKRTNSDEEDSEDDDDDFGFTIEYPDADPRHVQDRSFPPPASLERRFSEADFGAGSGSNDAAELDWSAFERERDRRNNAMDLDDDDDEEEFVDALRKKDEDVRLMPPPPRPLPRAPPVQATPKPPVNEPEVYTFDVASSDEDDADADANAEQQQDDDAGDDFDLEAELEAAFDKVEGGEEDPGGDSDSSVSEEE